MARIRSLAFVMLLVLNLYAVEIIQAKPADGDNQPRNHSGTQAAPTPIQFSRDHATYAIDHYTYNTYNYSQPSAGTNIWTNIGDGATAVIAFLTLFLWETTRRQGQDIKAQSTTAKKALVDVERPHLLFGKITMYGFYLPTSDIKPTAEEYFQRVNANRYPIITYGLKNYGKGPAWISSASIQFVAIVTLPLEPRYDKQPVIGYALPAGESGHGECSIRPYGATPAGITPEQFMDILKSNLLLFVYGFVEYVDVFKEATHKSGFCYKWTTPSTASPAGFWEPSGPESYWYYT